MLMGGHLTFGPPEAGCKLFDWAMRWLGRERVLSRYEDPAASTQRSQECVRQWALRAMPQDRQNVPLRFRAVLTHTNEAPVAGRRFVWHNGDMLRLYNHLKPRAEADSVDSENSPSYVIDTCTAMARTLMYETVMPLLYEAHSGWLKYDAESKQFGIQTALLRYGEYPDWRGALGPPHWRRHGEDGRAREDGLARQQDAEQLLGRAILALLQAITAFTNRVGPETRTAWVDCYYPIDALHPLDVSTLQHLYVKVSELSGCVRMMAGDWPYGAMWDDWTDRTRAALTLFQAQWQGVFRDWPHAPPVPWRQRLFAP